MERIAIWGCGKYCSKILQAFPLDMNNIEVFVDKEPKKQGKKFYGRKIIMPIDLKKYDISQIVIAIKNNEVVDEIIQEFADYSPIHIDQYCWKEMGKWGKRSCFLQNNFDFNDKDLKQRSFEELYIKCLLEMFNVVGLQMNAVPDSIYFHNRYPEYSKLCDIYTKRNTLNNLQDYNRLIGFMLNINRILEQNICGAFAELGVYLGNNCAVMMEYCRKYKRKLYMFDTFHGFDERDLVGIDDDQKIKFSDTSLETVRSFVGDNEYGRYVQGYFPDSATEECKNEKYAFVSLDCDLYKPIKSGLEFFYPRLSLGGMIFIHDYSSGFFEGCKRAVDEFIEKQKISITLMPDKSGTAVLVK